MNAISDTTLILTSLTALALLVGLASADAFREVLPLRRDLLSRLALARIYAVLQHRGIGIPAYLHKTPTRRMARHIRNCETCLAKRQCDAALGASEASDFAFCPNQDAASVTSLH